MSETGQYEFLMLMLLAIVVLELLARRLHLPSAAAFILGGVTLAVVPGVPTFTIDPQLILLVFLPPLLMNGGYFTVWKEFRENLSGIIVLAVGAVAFTTLCVGLVVHQLAPALPWAVCFALGAIVSPPDAVAANAVLERLSLPGALSALLQGESLLNDATGLVLFKFAVAAAFTGAFSITGAVGSFCLLTVGGVAFGWAMGRIGIVVLRRLSGNELAITVTLLLPVFSYIGGDRLGVSGVLATVTTGLLMGWHQHAILPAAVRMNAQAFWKVLVFLLEAVLFILIGLSLRGVLARVDVMAHADRTIWLPTGGVVLVVIASRFAWLFASDISLRVLRSLGFSRASRPSFPVATVMSWAGMRGVVTLAAALSLPEALPGRDLVLVCAFAVILVTVLLQGTTLGPLISWLQLTGPEEMTRRRDNEDRAWQRMAEAQHKVIASLSRQPDGAERHPRLLEQYAIRARLAAEFHQARESHQPIKVEHNAVVLKAIEGGRSEILRMHRAGEIHDRILRSLERELDLQQLVAESHID